VNFVELHELRQMNFDSCLRQIFGFVVQASSKEATAE